ncbi:MAG: hypothetical protein WDW36_008316 [Sanguina aurantia]
MRNNVLRVLQRISTGPAAGRLEYRLAACMEAASAARCLSSATSAASFASLPRLTGSAGTEAFPLSFALAAISRSMASAAAVSAEALTDVAVEGDAEALLRSVETVLASHQVTIQELSDAAVALTFLQLKGNRRIWGKLFEAVSARSAEFTAPTLAAFLWATTTANVSHYKTIAELAGPAASLLKGMTPAQLSVVVEALGAAGVADAQLYSAVSDVLSAKGADFKGADLARILGGLGASGAVQPVLAKALAKALAAKSGELGVREAAQAAVGLAHMRKADKATLDVLVKAAKSKMASSESAKDAAALAWSLATLGFKADGETVKALGAALKAGSAELTPSHAAQAAWGLSLLGGDKDVIAGLFSAVASAVEKAPDSLDVEVVALLHTAAAVSDVKLQPEAVAAYAKKVYSLSVDHTAHKLPAAAVAFRADLAEAVARALGARYRPEVAAAQKTYGRTAPDGSAVPLVMDLDKDMKVALLAADASDLSSTAPYAPLGPLLARARVLDGQGYHSVIVSSEDWALLKTPKAKAAYILTSVKSGVPSASAKVAALSKKLEEPFDAFAE